MRTGDDIAFCKKGELPGSCEECCEKVGVGVEEYKEYTGYECKEDCMKETSQCRSAVTSKHLVGLTAGVQSYQKNVIIAVTQRVQ